MRLRLDILSQPTDDTAMDIDWNVESIREECKAFLLVMRLSKLGLVSLLLHTHISQPVV